MYRISASSVGIVIVRQGRTTAITGWRELTLVSETADHRHSGAWHGSPRFSFRAGIQMTPYSISSRIVDQHASGSRKQFVSISSIRDLNREARSASGMSLGISHLLTRENARSICENDELMNDSVL
jgi:hypothetical protein